MFNALASLDAIVDADVLDLFAGSGALGIEALSRGAAHATFVEVAARTRAVVEANLAATGLVGRATVLGDAAERYLERLSSSEPDRRFDLALLDPPYAYDEWPALLSLLPARIAMIETDREPVLPPPWQVVRLKWYGSTLVVLATSHPVD